MIEGPVDPVDPMQPAEADALAAPAENGNVVVLWRSGAASFPRFVSAAHRAVGRHGTVGHLRVLDGSPVVTDRPRETGATPQEAADFADGIVAAASALSKVNDLVIVEIGEASRRPTWRNRNALALLRLARAGAATVMIADADSERSLETAVDRVGKLLEAAPELALHRVTVILDRVSDENGEAVRGARTALIENMVNGVFDVGRPVPHERRGPNRAEVVETGTTMQNAVFEILSLMRLPCLSVSDEAFDWLLGEGL